MPTYEFRCPLGHEFERFYRSIGTSEAQTACPECGQVAERQMSAGAGLVFKGSGFYLTDYGKDAHKKKDPAASKGDGSRPDSGSSGGDGAAPAAPSGGESATSESKSTKSESKSTKSESKSTEAKPTPKPSGGE